MIVKLNGGVIFLFLVNFVYGEPVNPRPCNSTNLVEAQCSPTETCVLSDKHEVCQCLPGHVRVSATSCAPSAPKSDDPQTPKPSKFIDDGGSSGASGHLAASILIPTLLIAIVICVVYFVRKYRVVSYIRKKMDQRNRNYDEVMIGRDLDDDDPPLS